MWRRWGLRVPSGRRPVRAGRGIVLRGAAVALAVASLCGDSDSSAVRTTPVASAGASTLAKTRPPVANPSPTTFAWTDAAALRLTSPPTVAYAIAPDANAGATARGHPSRSSKR